MAPNQRDPNKSSLSAYIHNDLKDFLKAEADRRGLTMNELLAQWIEEKYGDYAEKRAPKDRDRAAEDPGSYGHSTDEAQPPDGGPSAS